MSGTQSAYQSLAAELRQAIAAGAYPPGRRLPTEIELARSRSLSRQTVRQAFRELVAESLVYRVRGRGTFATPSSPNQSYLRSQGSIDELLALSLDTELEVVDPPTIRTDVAAASRLQCATDQVYVARFVRCYEDAPFCETTSYFPLAIGRQLVAEGTLGHAGARTPETVISVIERATGVVVAGAQQSIVAVPAPPEALEVLHSPPDQPLLRIDRLYYDRDGQLLELAVNHFDSSRYSYRLELRRSL
ncbi:MAG TPA: GntR family transcriptional regulator [Gaiellaceae bacterium]|jgi:DNA-binding GntR family transcriptional regulator|nr:GntR family transcriptional regulator [Gaiellaceae bacterium]